MAGRGLAYINYSGWMEEETFISQQESMVLLLDVAIYKRGGGGEFRGFLKDTSTVQHG